MAKSSTKGRYVCKVGFYDVYAKDNLKPAKESKNKWAIGEVILGVKYRQQYGL